MTKRQFSRAEIEYLRTLPSIDAVTDSRITYAREFQIDCMRRYLQGGEADCDLHFRGIEPIGHRAQAHRTQYRTLEARRGHHAQGGRRAGTA